MRVAFALLLVLLPALASAQDHSTLRILRPLAVDTAGTGLDAENRVYRAYQGIPYSIPVHAIGGDWPYTCSLSGAPVDMTVSAGPATVNGYGDTSCTITWVDPQATDSSITVQVCDVDNDCVSSTWGVTVATTAPGTNGYCFIDADDGNDTTGSGTLASPWQTLDKARDSCGAQSVLYFRGASAAYTLAGITTTSPGDCELQVSFSEASQPVTWLAYPGESPVLDIAYDGVNPAACIEMTGQNIWIQGLEVTNFNSMAFQMIRSSRYGFVFHGNYVHGGGNAIPGGNSAALMTVANYGGGGSLGTQSIGDTVTNNRFADIDEVGVGILYSWTEGLWANNTQTGEGTGSYGLAIKADITRVTVRNNSCVLGGDDHFCYDGNMDSHNSPDEPTSGEMLYNLVVSSEGIRFADSRVDSDVIGPWYVWRNTIVGGLYVRGVPSTDGEYRFTSNVIVNSTAASGSCPIKIECESVTDYTKLVKVTNLEGVAADSIVDASGLLTGTYRTDYLGLRGFELQGGGSSSNGGGVRLRLRGE